MRLKKKAILYLVFDTVVFVNTIFLLLHTITPADKRENKTLMCMYVCCVRQHVLNFIVIPKIALVLFCFHVYPLLENLPSATCIFENLMVRFCEPFVNVCVCV